MNWYLQSSNDSDVAISTRIRFSRNIHGYKFKLNKEETMQLEKEINNLEKK